jgi:hypothetical protein
MVFDEDLFLFTATKSSNFSCSQVPTDSQLILPQDIRVFSHTETSEMHLAPSDSAHPEASSPNIDTQAMCHKFRWTSIYLKFTCSNTVVSHFKWTSYCSNRSKFKWSPTYLKATCLNDISYFKWTTRNIQATNLIKLNQSHAMLTRSKNKISKPTR